MFPGLRSTARHLRRARRGNLYTIFSCHATILQQIVVSKMRSGRRTLGRRILLAPAAAMPCSLAVVLLFLARPRQQCGPKLTSKKCCTMACLGSTLVLIQRDAPLLAGRATPLLAYRAGSLARSWCPSVACPWHSSLSRSPWRRVVLTAVRL
jgi:hypothetical protein